MPSAPCDGEGAEEKALEFNPSYRPLQCRGQDFLLLDEYLEEKLTIRRDATEWQFLKLTLPLLYRRGSGRSRRQGGFQVFWDDDYCRLPRPLELVPSKALGHCAAAPGAIDETVGS